VIRRVLPAVLAVVAALGLAACGERKEPTGGARAAERIELVLDFSPNADHAGIYAAAGTGEFATAGLEVNLRTPPDPSAPLKLLAAGRADLAISYEPELLLARAKGAKVVAIGALVQKPLTSIISIAPKEIREPGQLEDRKIGTAGIPYQDAYLRTIIRRAGIDEQRVKSINLGFDLVPPLVAHKVDAVLGAYWNVEGVALARQDKKPTILRMDQIGVPTYNELVIVAREQDVRSRGAMLRRFMRALARGQQRLRANVAAGVDPLVKANPGLDAKLQTAQVKATLPVFFPAGAKHPFGFQDPAAWRAFSTWMSDNGLLARPEIAQRAFTNEFLPGEGI
jgi:putative hydroxymethylpyrimidine transport system substrate-binding protein